MPALDTTLQILRRADWDPPTILADDAAQWPAGEIDAWLEAGVMLPIAPAAALPCPQCAGDHCEEVVYLADPASDETRAYLPCPVHGPSRVPFAALRRWRIDVPALLRWVFARLAGGLDPRPVVADRLWRIGRARIEGRATTLMAGVRMNGRDAESLLCGARLPPNALLFVPHVLPGVDALRALPLPIVPLTSVVTVRQGKIPLDLASVAEQLALGDDVGGRRRKRPSSKRASRAGDIAALTAELREHLRAAYDHARSTRDHAGESRLLPRPTQRELAQRAGVTPSSASRCFADDSARELRFLWEIAADLDRIQTYGR